MLIQSQLFEDIVQLLLSFTYKLTQVKVKANQIRWMVF